MVLGQSLRRQRRPMGSPRTDLHTNIPQINSCTIKCILNSHDRNSEQSSIETHPIHSFSVVSKFWVDRKGSGCLTTISTTGAGPLSDYQSLFFVVNGADKHGRSYLDRIDKSAETIFQAESKSGDTLGLEVAQLHDRRLVLDSSEQVPGLTLSFLPGVLSFCRRSCIFLAG